MKEKSILRRVSGKKSGSRVKSSGITMLIMILFMICTINVSGGFSYTDENRMNSGTATLAEIEFIRFSSV